MGTTLAILPEDFWCFGEFRLLFNSELVCDFERAKAAAAKLAVEFPDVSPFDLIVCKVSFEPPDGDNNYFIIFL